MPRGANTEAALDEIRSGTDEPSIAAVARKHDVSPDTLRKHCAAEGLKVEPPADDRSDAERELAKRLREVEARAGRDAARAREAGGIIRDLRDEVSTLESTLDLVKMVGEHPDPDWLIDPPPAGDSHRGTLVSLFSDFHIGEAVDLDEMNGYNKYDKDIAELRVRRFFERTIYLAREHMAGVEFDGIVVPSLGDTISGDIHDEFRETNELSNFEAVPYAVKWIKRGLLALADEFGKVHVPCVPGNHPRDSKRPRYKKRSAHNADTLIFELIAAELADDDRITFQIPKSFSADFKVYDTRFRMEHGDEAKGGTGIQGALSPLALRAHRIRKQAQAEGVPFDVLLMGHWHQVMPLASHGFIVNGAGKGYDEYARGKGFAPERAQQLMFLVTPEHGISDFKPVFVSDRSEEGW